MRNAEGGVEIVDDTSERVFNAEFGDRGDAVLVGSGFTGG